MDQGDGKRRPTNPRKTASIFSVITFFYTLDLFRKGRKKDLEVKDIYEVLPDFQSKKLGDELEKHWTEDKKKNGKPSLYRITWTRYGRTYLLLGAFNVVVQIGFVMLRPKALGKFVSYFSPTTTLTLNDAWYFAGIIIGLTVLKCLFDYFYMQILREYAIKVCTSFGSLLYRKSLKLTPPALDEITMGKIVTLLNKDVFTFESAMSFFNDMWNGIVLMIVVTYLIYSRIGAAVFVGMGFILVCMPLQLYIGKKTSELRLECSKKTDDRIQVTQEALSAIKIIKMYTWEYFFQNHVTKARKIEIEQLRKIYNMKALSITLGQLIANVSFCLIVLANSWLGHDIDAETVYFIVSCFQTLKMFINISIPLGIVQSAELVASLTRLDTVMNAEELRKPKFVINDKDKPKVYLNEVAVLLRKELLKNVSLSAESGLTIVTGNVGSGKSTLLKVILGEYPIFKGILNVQGTISYASQEPWVFPSTVRQNILFGLEYNEKRYNEIITVCALTHDINVFEKGDQTIVGDKGINLSKGQKARISLARACYKNSDIYLLDDCLTALDASVNKFVFQKCIKGFLKDKIVIFVSHNLFHLRNADHTLLMNEGRTLSLQGQKNRLSKRVTHFIDDTRFSRLLEADQIIPIDSETDLLVNKNLKSTKNIYEEKKQSGKVKFDVYQSYYRFYGGFFAVSAVMCLFVVTQFQSNFAEKLVSKWVNLQAKITAMKLPYANASDFVSNVSSISSEFNSTTTLNATVLNSTIASPLELTILEYKSTFNLYVILMLTVTVFLFVRAYLHFFMSSRSSRKLHDSMVSSLLNSYMQFFDVHFIGNILNRFSKDLSAVDEYIPFLIFEVFRIICLLVGVTILISTVNPYYLLPAAVFALFVYCIRSYYIPIGRSLRRLDAATRSPMIGFLNASLDGLTTIRAYENETKLREEFDRHQDLFSSNWYMVQCSQRAFGFLIDMVGISFVAVVVFGFLVAGTVANSGDVGLAITQAFILTAVLSWTTKQFTELESQITSVERVLEYTKVKQESKKSGRRIANWPSAGKIEYLNVNLIYETTQEHILKNINFTIESKQKIGIVGRTGAGKSSIVSTLFRLYDVTGSIRIDGVDIKQLNLEFLRSSIAIIPQDPILFSGTIRANIDPTNRFTDAEIWSALRTVKLTDMVPNLNFRITESGSKYSAGQRQLICLARALVTKNKIIILDEATANMDPETDKLLHDTIKVHFAESTVLTVAHRLNSIINSDKILVLDDGKVMEFDSPNNLLSKEGGLFAKMAKQASIRTITEEEEDDEMET